VRSYKANLSSVSPYSQSRYHDTEKQDRETADAYENRTWKNRLHVNGTGKIFIPPMAFKNCLSECAKFMSVQIPGKGKQTYTKHFEAGILIHEPVHIGISPDSVPGEWLFVPADGKRGSGKRVKKCFPLIAEWAGELVIHVVDEIITRDVLLDHLVAAGSFIGIGRFRPRNNGYYGRFQVDDLS
jgi:hypothetical protein